MTSSPDLHSLIARLRSIGMSDTVIENRLKLEGWSHEEIAPILELPHTSAKHETPTAVEQEWESRTAKIQKKNRVPLFAIIIAVFTLGAGVSLHALYRPAVVYSISLPAGQMEFTSSVPTLVYGALPELSNPNYYAQVKQSLIDSEASFIDADLSKMQLSVYRDGAVALTVAIAAKGKPGSWWETPAGIYKIETKEANHLSSIGDVYMPWSMDFQGNFFIHGWPYYKDGTPVSSSFSGGCIRLSTEDAKAVYGLVKTGMPVVVHSEIMQGDTFTYQLNVPPISAQAYLVADLSNGTVLASKNASTSAPIASITKLVTALVATEYINLDRKITVQQDALVYTAVPRLTAGDSVRAYDLLFLLLQESSNEAAETLARDRGRDLFIQYMNQKAQAIGLTHTTFADVSGAKDDYSTPEDLFTLLRYIYDNRQFVFALTTGNLKDSAYGQPRFKGLANFNIVPNVGAKLIGGKVGETNAAGKTYAGIFLVQVGGEGRKIAVIVLGSQDEYADVRSLVSFVENEYAPGKK